MANVSLAKSRVYRSAGLQRAAQRTPGAAVAKLRDAQPGKPVQEEKAAQPGNSAKAGKSRFAHYASRPILTKGPALFGIGLAAALTFGWMNRDEEYIIPDNGLGYWLGVVGASIMLLLLLYPLRKRVRMLGSIPAWFRLHMILGVIGPALILFHSNFRLGSLNSNVALAAMLIVATSGIIGRYLYGKIHVGLYGRKAVVGEMLADAELFKRSLGDDLAGLNVISEQMNAFAKSAAAMPRGLIARAFALPVLGVRARILRSRLKGDAWRLVAMEGKRKGWSRRVRVKRHSTITKLVDLYVTAVKKAAAFEFWDRLFGLWHLLHLPLFFILIFAAIAHVIAAHLY